MSSGKHTDQGTQRRSKIRSGIQVKFLVWFTGLFTVAFIVLGLMIIKGLPFSSFDGWSGNTKREAVSSLDLIAELEKINLTRWFRERQGDAQVVAGSQIIKGNLAPLLATVRGSATHDGLNKKRLPRAPDNAPDKQIYNFITSVKKAYEQSAAAKYERIRIVDPKTARVLVSTDSAENGFIVDPGEKYLVQVIRTRHYFVSDVSTAGPNSVPHINIAQPVFDPDGALIGIVALEIVLANIFDHLLHSTHSLGATGEVLMVDEQSRILTPLRHPLPDGTQARLLEHQITANPARFAAAGREGLIESDDYRDHKVIAAYRHLRITPDWGWGMVVKIDEAQLFATINKGINFSLWLGGVGIVLVIVLSSFLTDHLTGPLRQMTRVARRMASGDLAARTQIDSNDEIGQLSSAFDSMATDIEHWHQDLERRISERTSLLDKEIQERKRIEQKVRQLNLSLEKKVTARTSELAAVNQELESFAYSVAHDLRVPLRAIDGFSQALVEDYGERLDGEAKEFLGYLREGSQEMGLLIDDLLKLSRATRGAISRQDIDLSQLAADCMQALQQTEPDRKVEVDITAGIIINADRRLMQVMLENLLENAWKFTAREAAAKIEFGAETVGKKVRCFIRDNGVGFDMAYQNKLFTPFTRLHSSKDFKGTGIGLSTVQRIINRHGGMITAQSHVGEGACFTFELDSAENDVHDDDLVTISHPPGDDG